MLTDAKQMKRRTILHLLLVVTLLFAGCVSPKKRARIDQIVELSAHQPQKALLELEQLDPAQFRTPKEKAALDLLHTILLDKNYIDLKSDSLIAYPYNYYLRHTASDSIRSLVHYYRGRIHQNCGEFAQAASEYLAAYQRLTPDNHYRQGLHHSRLAELYYLQKNYPHALKNYQTAYDCYLKAAKQGAANDTMGSIANVLAVLKRYDEAERWYKQSLEAGERNRDTAFMAISLTNLQLLYHDTGNSQATLCCFDRLRALGKNYLAASNYLCVANALLVENRLSEAEHYLKKATQSPPKGSEALLHYVRARIAISKGDFRDAIEHQLRFVISADSLRQQNYAETVAESEQLFYARLSDQVHEQLQMRNVVIVFVILITLCLIACVFMAYRHRVLRQEDKIRSYIETAEQLQKQYRVLQQALENHTEESDRCRNLLASHFAVLDELCQSIFERKNDKDQREAIYKSVRQRLHALTNDPHTQSDLEAVINAVHRDLMVRLRAQVPSFTQADHCFLLLVYAGFSAQVISLATQETVANVYARKYRLKQRIKKSDAPDKEDFIAAMR